MVKRSEYSDLLLEGKTRFTDKGVYIFGGCPLVDYCLMEYNAVIVEVEYSESAVIPGFYRYKAEHSEGGGGSEAASAASASRTVREGRK